jgi:O-antigen/teichoic acid export membrane protein
MMLADLGMTNSIMRLLLEAKSGGDSERYGKIFTVSVLTMAVSGLIVMLCGGIAAVFSRHLFDIPSELASTYVNVMLLKTALTAVSLATNMVGVPLYVHHRQDLGQICQMFLFVIYFAVLYIGLELGWGIYALVANQVAGFVWSVSFNCICCHRAGFYPSLATCSLPDRAETLSIFRFSKDVFTIQIGNMVLNSLPQLLITRTLGLEANASWAVFTRPFAIIKQVVNRPFDVMLPMIYESYDRNDMERVTRNWANTCQIILASAAVAFSVAAANNVDFVDVWTGGKIHGADHFQWAIALYFFFTLASGLAYGSIGMKRPIGRSRFTGILQAVATILVGLPATRYFGMEGLLIVIALLHAPGLLLNGVIYLGQLTGRSLGSLFWASMGRPVLAAPTVIFAAVLCSRVVDSVPGFFGLFLSCATGVLAGAAFMLAFGIDAELRRIALRRLTPLYNKLVCKNG